MKYEKPEVNVEKFTFEPILAEVTSSIDPDPTPKGPVIEENDPTFELASAFDSVFNFNK
ncbi:MAG: hypothetical protein MJ147_08610 [Clostridia bacterium]|nr:hypothetical protein [Clostridia bacterium]MCQ2472083.1 hypothetical protein [Clostridia bacterium]